eukprot:TRINITY_DN2722_c0_g1_i1.p1 TRINITY_DN2722_c0_g1~~TRINITY_DN2722_c0_g1_i1.p1  ORF type:complete len:873 (+),score=237.03 TRINITY_DN2722_c0_g1_i1:339-2621(+)
MGGGGAQLHSIPAPEPPPAAKAVASEERSQRQSLCEEEAQARRRRELAHAGVLRRGVPAHRQPSVVTARRTSGAAEQRPAPRGPAASDPQPVARSAPVSVPAPAPTAVQTPAAARPGSVEAPEEEPSVQAPAQAPSPPPAPAATPLLASDEVAAPPADVAAPPPAAARGRIDEERPPPPPPSPPPAPPPVPSPPPSPACPSPQHDAAPEAARTLPLGGTVGSRRSPSVAAGPMHEVPLGGTVGSRRSPSVAAGPMHEVPLGGTVGSRRSPSVGAGPMHEVPRASSIFQRGPDDAAVREPRRSGAAAAPTDGHDDTTRVRRMSRRRQQQRADAQPARAGGKRKRVSDVRSPEHRGALLRQSSELAERLRESELARRLLEQELAKSRAALRRATGVDSIDGQRLEPADAAPPPPQHPDRAEPAPCPRQAEPAPCPQHPDHQAEAPCPQPPELPQRSRASPRNARTPGSSAPTPRPPVVGMQEEEDSRWSVELTEVRRREHVYRRHLAEKCIRMARQMHRSNAASIQRRGSLQPLPSTPRKGSDHPDALALGTPVVTVGLRAHTEYNGLSGVVIAHREDGEALVHLAKFPKQDFHLKWANLQRLDATPPPSSPDGGSSPGAAGSTPSTSRRHPAPPSPPPPRDSDDRAPSPTPAQVQPRARQSRRRGERSASSAAPPPDASPPPPSGARSFAAPSTQRSVAQRGDAEGHSGGPTLPALPRRHSSPMPITAKSAEIPKNARRHAGLPTAASAAVLRPRARLPVA